MTAARGTAAVAALLALSGCAGAGASLDRFADQAEARSSCHTSSGEWVRTPSCTMSYSRTVTTSTTTTTTTAPPPAGTDD